MGSAEVTLDGHVRVAEADLPRLRIRHLTSQLDSSIAVPDRLLSMASEVITGYTEWVGTWGGAQVSLGWDWGSLRGEIFVLSPAEIRTNIQLVTPDGAAESPMLCRMHLARWLEESLPWRESAVRDLVEGREGG
jgi:Domain of unknown function (DUF4902)